MIRDSWRTPPKLFEYIRSRYNTDVDICASDTNHLLPVYFTQENSALDADWCQASRTKVVFCNPPYSNPKPFIDKACEEADKGVTTVFLLNLDPSTKWFVKALTRAVSVVLLTGSRVRFIPPDGVEESSNSKPQCLIVIGDYLGYTDTEYFNYRDFMND